MIKPAFLVLWRYLWVRLLVGWLVIAILPAMWRWTGRILRLDLLDTQFNSLVLASVGVVLTTLALNRLSQFPGQRSFSYVLPTLLFVVLLLASVLLIFRLPYSLYYLAFASMLGLLFFLVSYLLEQKISKPFMAYIPLGRCQNFETSIPINWLRLDKPQLDPEMAKRIDGIVADLASPKLNDDWQRFLTKQTLCGVPVFNQQQVYESLTGRSPIQHLYENDLGSLLPSQNYLIAKQLLDMLVVILVSPLVVPICVLTAVAIRFESPGKAIFVQERVGQGGKLFKIYKFRSMYSDAEKHGAKLAQKNDSRVTKIGKFIRKTRIDELPQFINVLKGEMSLIGPRPEQLSFVKEFEQKIPFYNYRHIVKPGISGWAQVTQGYAGNEDETALKIQYDFFYIKNISLALDLLIVIKTVQTMLTGFGAR
ncbi:undecaprenyl-galactosyl transferase [Moraxella macacae 0408225]|uniref:Undecaprenyl-galactosyl transferase n=1 Tax=Moraxella macacae 0408225 TaxID=1230338 RepID=L2F4P5_9GAMM|nr:exopolysaccharide biosynthesis polyprenyl glycosylphosphotransferase [Moraxella macacae]ELA07982.1 undecaprenyl-galactosyl transferase [Moraxella macacae 0408225]